MKRYIIFLVCVFAATVSVFAQSAGLNLSIGIPGGDFAKQVDRAAVGANLEIFFLQPREHFPYSFGIDLGYYNYGYQSTRGRFYDGPYSYDADIERTNNIARFNILFRVQPQYKNFTPYLDMFIGPSYLYTKTSITDYSTGDELTGDVNKSSWIWNYGFGGGVLIKLSGDNKGYFPPFEDIYFDLKARYNMSTLGEYLTESSIKVNPSNGDIYFTSAKTTVDYISISAGVHVTFSSFIPETEETAQP